MPYRKSPARIAFETGARSLKQVAKKVSYESSPLNYEQKLLIYQSTVFLMSAKLEEYTKTLIEDLIFSYKSRNAVMNDIPENIRTKAIVDNQLSSYKNHVFNPNERKLLRNANCKNEYYKVLDSSNSFSNVIKPQLVIATNKYPSVKNLKILYFRIGIDNIFDGIARRGKKDFKGLLESFLSVREAIAHQQAPELTHRDVERHINNLSGMINSIDRVVYSHITKVSGERFWG